MAAKHSNDPNKVYGDEAIQEAVDLYKKGASMAEVSRNLSVPYKTVRLWIRNNVPSKNTLKTKLADDAKLLDPIDIVLDPQKRLERAGRLAPKDLASWCDIGETYAKELNIQEWQAREIVKAISLGVPERLAVSKGAVTLSDFDDWIKLSNRGIQPYKEWIQFLQIAQVSAITDLVAQIREGGAKNWQGSAWLLARLRPEYFHKEVIRDQHNNALSEMDDEILQKAAREWISGIDSDAEYNKKNPMIVDINDFNLD